MPDDEDPYHIEDRQEEQTGNNGEAMRDAGMHSIVQGREPDPQRRQQEADEQGPGIAHKQYRGMEVVSQEAGQSAGECKRERGVESVACLQEQ